MNLPDCREYAKLLALEGIRVCTRAEEEENNQAERQIFDPLVSELERDEKLVEINRMLLLQYQAKNSA